MTMTEPDDTSARMAAVEGVHRAYYAAWERGDTAAATGLWADSDDISCTFPGLPGVVGRRAVFEQVVEGIVLTAGVQFIFEDLQIVVRGDVARLTCVENVLLPGTLTLEEMVDLPTSRLAVTSLFCAVGSDWRLWTHHCGPVMDDLERESQ